MEMIIAGEWEIKDRPVGYLKLLNSHRWNDNLVTDTVEIKQGIN